MIGWVISSIPGSDSESDMNKFTGSSTTGNLDVFTTAKQSLIEVSHSRVETSSTDTGLIQHTASTSMPAVAYAPVSMPRAARLRGMGNQAQVRGQLLGIFTGGKAIGYHQQPGRTQWANAFGRLQPTGQRSPDGVSKQTGSRRDKIPEKPLPMVVVGDFEVCHSLFLPSLDNPIFIR
jgi:hypothetical protein